MCDILHSGVFRNLPTNLAIDDRLIEEARKIGHHSTKKEAVTAALDEYIRRRKQMQILDLFDTIDLRQGYDYKANRRRDRVESER
jgi:Arc/MetJ family transcription regulator